MHWRWPNQQRWLYLIISSILEIPIWVLRSDIAIFSHNLAEQIHLTIVLSFLTSQWMSSTLTTQVSLASTLTTQVSLAYSRTLWIQALYARPLTFSKMPLFVSTGSKMHKFFQAALTLSAVASKQLPDQWNHLLLQTYHFRLSLLDCLGRLSWCCWYRHYTWKMDLPLTFLWFWSISCEPSGYSFGRRSS